jgi:hypothetical protein
VSDYLFNAVNWPEITEEHRERAKDIIATARKAASLSGLSEQGGNLPINIAALQCSEGEGDRRSVAAIVPVTCATKRSISRSEFGSDALNQGAAARLQFSSVTGTPAKKQASMALLARVLAVTTSTMWRYSSSVMAALRLVKPPRSHESRNTATAEGGKAGDAAREADR